jgi:hypothetical protein
VTDIDDVTGHAEVEMKQKRITRWVTGVGAVVGTLLTWRVIADLRDAVDAGGTGIPGLAHIVFCWPVLLALVMLPKFPQPIFYSIIALANATTFAFIFFGMAKIVFLGSSRRRTGGQI